MRQKIGRLLAWAVTLGVLVYLFSTVSPAKILRAMGGAAPWTVPVLAALVLVIYLADTFAIWRTFGWFVARLGFLEVLAVRGATYLLALVNYAVGQGAIVYFVNRSRGIPLLRGAAAVLLVMGINLLLLLFISSAGLMFAAEAPAWLGPVVMAAYGGLAVYLALLLLRPRWLRTRPIFDVLFDAGIRGHLKALAVRLPHVSSLVLFTYVALHAFGIRVPLGQAVLCLPVVYFVAVLPISIQGIGPSQALMIFFFARYATGADQDARTAAVLACSFGSQAIAFCVQLILGLVCMRTAAARKIQDVTADATVRASA